MFDPRTTGKPHTLGMGEVLKNIELRGSTMGSLEEFKSAIAFVDKHKIRPVVYKTLDGLEEAEEGFQILKNGQQFGKVVVRISQDAPSSKL
jgi:D-arabinose 1-dehydrogenase-like Zn-dependent alcohol dehydrogenase